MLSQWGFFTRDGCKYHRREENHRWVLTSKEASQWFLFKILVWKQRVKLAKLQSVYIPKSLQRETTSSQVALNTLLLPFSVLPLALPQKLQSPALHTCSLFSPLKNCPCWVILFKSVKKDLKLCTSLLSMALDFCPSMGFVYKNKIRMIEHVFH